MKYLKFYNQLNECGGLFNYINENKILFITKESKIAGKGNFAIKDIKKGTNLGLGLTKIGNTNNPDTDYERYDLCTFTNHSKTPNLYYKKTGKKYFFYALKDIKTGEELTIDYRKFDFEGERSFVK